LDDNADVFAPAIQRIDGGVAAGITSRAAQAVESATTLRVACVTGSSKLPPADCGTAMLPSDALVAKLNGPARS